MSTANAGGNPAAAKKKKKGKKKANGQATPDSAATSQNGGLLPSHPQDSLHIPSSPAKPGQPAKESGMPVPNGTSSLPAHTGTKVDPDEPEDDDDDDDDDNGEDDVPSARPPTQHTATLPGDTTSRLDAMQQERDSLRAEVTQLRKSLESLQEKHNEELAGVKVELEETEQNREHAHTQYTTLLGKVNTIRSQLGERLKADAAALEEARERIEELETSNRTAHEENERLQKNVSKLNNDMDSRASEIEILRSRTNTSTNNWARERDDLVKQEARVREEYEAAKQAMQDWEILAIEERSRREVLEDRVQELEEQLSAQREAFQRVQGEADTQSSTVDGLQRALRDLQEERKRELREIVEQSQTQLDTLRAQTRAAEEAASEVKSQLETAQQELERTAPFEKEVKEKNLLIGKLRHEAVILNDHLTKALRFLKRGKPEDNVDRQIVTNHFLHFLQLDRSDPKKFQILQLIAALLGWDEQQREQAGLLRQGSGFANAGGSLRVPLSPFRRTPSTPALTGDFSPISPGGEGRESLAELWSEFLERESESGSTSSRRPSMPHDMRRPSAASQGGIMSPRSEKGGFFGRSSPDSKRKESSGAVAGLGLSSLGRTDSGGSGK